MTDEEVNILVWRLRTGRGLTESARRDAWVHGVMLEAADALTAAQARIEEVEKERDALAKKVAYQDEVIEQRHCMLERAERERDEARGELNALRSAVDGITETADTIASRCTEVEKERDEARAAFERFSNWIPADMAGRISISAEWYALADLMRAALSAPQTHEGGE